LQPQPFNRTFHIPERQIKLAQEFSRIWPLATHSRTKLTPSPHPQVPEGQQIKLLQLPEIHSPAEAQISKLAFVAEALTETTFVPKSNAAKEIAKTEFNNVFLFIF
jgi:hypothetical protein